MTRGVPIPIKLPPGVIRDMTEYASEGRYVDVEHVRFRKDLPEKIGGWKLNADYMTTGVPRTTKTWRTLADESIIAVGTASHVQVIFQGSIYDITPLRKTTNPLGSNPIDTTSGSTTVTITDTSFGGNPGDFIVVSGAAAAGGITIVGEYEIQTTPTANTYTITAASAATSTVTGGGSSVVVEYLVTTGFDSTAGGLGWGAGGWGGSTWGSPRSGGDATSTEVTYWTFALWGEDLLMTKRNGGTYIWDTSGGVATRAALVSNAPATAKINDVNQDIKILVLYGAHTGSVVDPMLVRWSDQDDNTNWTPGVANTAGSFQLTGGTTIVSKIQSRNQTLIFTDTSLYAQQYTAQPFIFNFRLLAEDITIVGMKATGEINGTVFFMGHHNFYAYTGQVSVLDCPMRRYVFDNINEDNKQKSYVAINTQFQEVWFFYPRGANTECSHYVAYYYGEPQKNIWHDGTLARSAWNDSEKFLANPIAFDAAGCYFNHEFGDDDDTAAMSAYIESGAIEIDDPSVGAGGALLLSDKFIPDMVQTGDVKVSFYTKKYPQDANEVTKGPFTIGATTAKLSFRAKGRQIRVRYASDALGDKWRIGTNRLRMKPVSKR